jgi:type VI secretion system protein ImpM
MDKSPLVGVYGKLPAHGDFIQRNLPPDFINHWDEWLQHFIAGSREQMAENWLDIYLTSPIWRFVLSPGVVDRNCWSGIMMPSVDRVGRYFPLSIACRLSGMINPLEFLARQVKWFEDIEELALGALQYETSIDDLVLQIKDINLEPITHYSKVNNNQSSNSRITELNASVENMLDAFSCMLDSVLTEGNACYSSWTTTGSERVQPCLFTTSGLPPLNGLSAMMDGQWTQWNWNQPYILNNN